ncbi:MAG: D-2-hydroxyacid dehydrogenase [Acetobacteraceae bacterium]|nr:D-2-hydroxyacid dehydrogenase [Acetobacteraceae bacterium]
MTHTIMIASPLEPENVALIRETHRELEVLYDPALLPPVRYVADHKGIDGFTRTPLQQARWVEMLGAAEILWDLPAAEDLPHLGQLKWIQTTSTGVGQYVATMGLAERDVLVTTARGVHARPLAEFVFMALLSHWRGLDHLRAEQKAHSWVRMCGEEVAGRRLVTIGAGDLARGCAKLARAFDMSVVAVARDPGRARAHNDLFDAVVPVAEMHRALAQADAVVVTVPHTAATVNLVDAAAFAAMPQGVAFVNIARGTVVDEDALIEALASGRIGFAALDVARVEPLAKDSPLWDMGNVLISPHSASTVSSENRRITEIFRHNLLCWVDGRLGEMRNVLDKRLLY